MRTFVPLKQSLQASILFIFISASSVSTNARVLTGLQTDNGSVQPGPVATIDRSAFSIITNKLASFTVSLTNNKAELKWTTENEINLNHMLVGKSMDGKYFRDAAMIFTYGNTTSRSD